MRLSIIQSFTGLAEIQKSYNLLTIIPSRTIRLEWRQETTKARSESLQNKLWSLTKCDPKHKTCPWHLHHPQKLAVSTSSYFWPIMTVKHKSISNNSISSRLSPVHAFQKCSGLHLSARTWIRLILVLGSFTDSYLSLSSLAFCFQAAFTFSIFSHLIDLFSCDI